MQASTVVASAAMIAGASAELLWTARNVLLDAATRHDWRASAETAALVEDLAREDGTTGKPAPGVLAAASRAFELSAAETAALALAAAVEIDVRLGALLSRVQGSPALLRPTVGTLVDLTGVSVAAFIAEAPLRRYALVDLEGDGPLMFRTVRCPDACWGRLAGVPAPPPAPMQDLDDLVLDAEVRASVRDIAEWLTTEDGRDGLVVVAGRSGSGRQGVARALLIGRRGFEVSADPIADVRGFIDVEREARWANRVPILVSEAPGPSPHARAWIDRSTGARIWIQADPPEWIVDSAAAARVLQVPELGGEHRTELWRRALRGPAPEGLEGELATRFRFGPGRIRRVVDIARGRGEITLDSIVSASRATSRPGIAVLAERLEARTRDDLVVSANVARELDIAIAWAGSHARMYGAWGLTTSVTRARGVTCLFAGPPGTGKTLAAQIMAGAIERDLFRVDLAQAVSKWLGETEKNLGRIFDEARDVGAVLFFDEADALFARRTQVSDSNDRYANLETGYLLQRLESHDGVVILATNRQQDLDSAFQRRFEVIIDFQAPGPTEREQLWRRHLPVEERCGQDVDAPALATLFELSGGQIRNAIMTSVALTELDGDATQLAMRHLIGGATRELMRAGRLVNPAEYGEWAQTVRSVVDAARV
jgi:DNA polymerase III delta prime subunit